MKMSPIHEDVSRIAPMNSIQTSFSDITTIESLRSLCSMEELCVRNINILGDQEGPNSTTSVSPRSRDLTALSHVKNQQFRKKTTFGKLSSKSSLRTFDYKTRELKRIGSLDRQLERRGMTLEYFNTKATKKATDKRKFMSNLLDTISCKCGDITDTLTSENLADKKRCETIENESGTNEPILYDSDPEFMVRSPMDFKIRSSWQRDDDDTEDDVNRNKVKYSSDCRRDSSADTNEKEEVMDEESIYRMLEIIRCDYVIMRFCIPQSTNVDNSVAIKTSTIIVKVWIEMGCHIGGNLIQPKLVWRSEYGSLIDQTNSALPNDAQRSILSNPLCIGGIDLLNIVRIISSPNIDRSAFPLVSKRTAFMIATSSSYFLFEAATVEEKDTFVFALKLLVARFISMIVCQDTALIEEFFIPATHRQPCIPE